MKYSTLRSGYKLPYDVTIAINKISSANNENIWAELWEQLIHQGDIGEASLLFVVLIPEIIDQYDIMDYNPIGLAVAIELARDRNGYKQLPSWISEKYEIAIAKIAANVARNINKTNDLEYLRCGLAILAISKKCNDLAELIFEVSPGDERILIDQYFEL